jgi:hypothetical protein
MHAQPEVARAKRLEVARTWGIPLVCGALAGLVCGVVGLVSGLPLQRPR